MVPHHHTVMVSHIPYCCVTAHLCVGLLTIGGMFVSQGFRGTQGHPGMHRNLGKQVMQQMNQQQQGQQAAKDVVKPIKDTNVLLKDVAGIAKSL